jgi:hypothetical protein
MTAVYLKERAVVACSCIDGGKLRKPRLGWWEHQLGMRLTWTISECLLMMAKRSLIFYCWYCPYVTSYWKYNVSEAGSTSFFRWRGLWNELVSVAVSLCIATKTKLVHNVTPYFESFSSVQWSWQISNFLQSFGDPRRYCDTRFACQWYTQCPEWQLIQLSLNCSV